MRHCSLVPPVVLAIALVTAPPPTAVGAAEYPPACPDSISIWNIQNPSATCHPTVGDTVWVGIGGIVTARDTKAPGFAIWVQLSGGGEYSGIRVSTGIKNWPVTVGDSVIVRPSKISEYGGETELVSLTGSFGDDLYVYRALSGHALPPIHQGNTTDFDNLPSNTALEPWEGCLVQCNPRGGPLRVARNVGLGASFMVVDDACTTGVCDSVLVDISTIPDPSLGAPTLGAKSSYIRGIVGQSSNGYLIRVRDDNPWTTPVPTKSASWGRIQALYR